MEKRTRNFATAVLILIALVTIGTVVTCNYYKNKANLTKLDITNDSLLKVVQQCNLKADSILKVVDSLSTAQSKIKNSQTIVNKHYHETVYNILNSDSKSLNSKLKSSLKESDSLYKSGFYFLSIPLSDTTDKP